MSSHAPSSPIWSHLRTWRKRRGLSQEYVAAELHTRHTTVGRWETGKTKMTTDNLEALASLYEVSVCQLISPPTDATRIDFLERAATLLDKLPPDDADYWVGMGERLAKTPK